MSRDAIQAAIEALEKWKLYSFAEGSLPELAAMLKNCCETTDAALDLLRAAKLNGEKGGG